MPAWLNEWLMACSKCGWEGDVEVEGLGDIVRWTCPGCSCPHEEQARSL